MEVLLWGTFLFLVLLNGVEYFFEIDIIASISNILSGKPQITIDDNVIPDKPPVPEITVKKQVFTFQAMCIHTMMRCYMQSIWC